MGYEIAIFSYNRGSYLQNCIGSVLSHCPGTRFTVYDDGSDEPNLVQYLQELGPKVRHMKSAESGRHGGFYRNMQAALDEAKSDFLLLLQDDVQVVRDVTQEDIRYWQHYTQGQQACAFLSPVFMKGVRRKDFLRYYRPDPSERVYHWHETEDSPSKDGPVPRFYMDVCILDVKKLKQQAWSFQDSEFLNGEQAGQLFSHGMPQLADPFVFYVPEEPVYRSRVKSKGTQLAEKLAGNTVKRFISMSDQEVHLLKNRSLAIYPFAEDFIQTQDPAVKKPYQFNVYRSHWLARLINKFEKLLKK